MSHLQDRHRGRMDDLPSLRGQTLPPKHGDYFFCGGCQQMRDGQAVALYRGQPCCSADCFDRIVASYRLVEDNPAPLPGWIILLSVMFWTLVIWGMTR